MWRKTILNMADGIITLRIVARSWHWFRKFIPEITIFGDFVGRKPIF